MSAADWEREAEAQSRRASQNRQSQNDEAAIERNVIANVATKVIRKDEEDHELVLYRSINAIADSILRLSSGWPKSVSGALFTLKGEGNNREIRTFRRTEEFFAWLQMIADMHWVDRQVTCPRTGAARTPVTKAEMFRHLEAVAPERFRSFASLPHYPPMSGVYYLPFELPQSDGSCLRDFRARLNADSEADADLMIAALATPGWGGAPGGRPAFIFTSDRKGRGVGKTTTMEVFAHVWGGAAVTIRPKDKWDEVVKKLLSDSGLSRRVILMDNVKRKLGGEELESILTAYEIDGWRPFHGGFSRLNFLTTYISSNAPQLSSDLTPRSVIVKLGAARHEDNFRAWAFKFVDDNRPHLLADLLGASHGLARPPVGIVTPENRDRFGGWQDGVLCPLFVNADAIARLVINRRGEGVDVDEDEAIDVAGAVRAWIAKQGYDPDECRINIDRDQMVRILVDAKVTEIDNKRGIYTWISNMLGPNGALAPLRDHSSRKYGRQWVWDTSDEPEIPDEDPNEVAPF